jgi:hypothetical protein
LFPLFSLFVFQAYFDQGFLVLWGYFLSGRSIQSHPSLWMVSNSPRFICLVSIRCLCESHNSYSLDDLLESQQKGTTWKPSAISQINGQPVLDYLLEFASINAFGTLEFHSDFNQLMTSPAQDIQAVFNKWGGGAEFYPGDTLKFVLENGTTITTPWLAVFNSPGPTGPLETGGDFYSNNIPLLPLQTKHTDKLLQTFLFWVSTRRPLILSLQGRESVLPKRLLAQQQAALLLINQEPQSQVPRLAVLCYKTQEQLCPAPQQLLRPGTT